MSYKDKVINNFKEILLGLIIIVLFIAFAFIILGLPMAILHLYGLKEAVIYYLVLILIYILNPWT